MVHDKPEFPREAGYPVRQYYKFGEAPEMSVAFQCSVALIVLFFFVEASNTVYRSCTATKKQPASDSTSFESTPEERVRINQASGRNDEMIQGGEHENKNDDAYSNMFDRLATVTSSIPMLLLLFLISRLHGTVDLEGTEPDQFTKEKGFVFATVCLYLEATFMVVPNSLYKIIGKLILISRIIARFLYHVAIVIILVKFFEMVKY